MGLAFGGGDEKAPSYTGFVVGMGEWWKRSLVESGCGFMSGRWVGRRDWVLFGFFVAVRCLLRIRCSNSPSVASVGMILDIIDRG